MADGIISAKRDFARRLAGNASVLAIGVGFREKGGSRTDEIAIVVHVAKKRPVDCVSADQRIPAHYGRYRVDVQERAYRVSCCAGVEEEPGLVELCRPLMGGTAMLDFQRDPFCRPAGSSNAGDQLPIEPDDSLERGTLGCIVRHVPSGKICALTNQHVVTSELRNVAYDLSGNDNPEASAREYTGIKVWQGFPPLDPSEFSPKVIGEKKAYDKSRTCCYWLCGAADDPPHVGLVFQVAPDPIDAALVAITGGLQYETSLAQGLQPQAPLLLEGDDLVQLLQGTKVVKRGHATHLTTGTITEVEQQLPDFDTGNACKSTPPVAMVIEPVEEGEGDGNGFFRKRGRLRFVLSGDSGSLVLRKSDSRIVGLVFGGVSVGGEDTENPPPPNGDTTPLRGFAVDIKRVVDALSIEFLPGGGGPQTVPSNNLDGITERSPSGSGIRFADRAARAKLWTLRRHMARDLPSRAFLSTFEGARAEIASLIERHRTVRVAWHKNHGPTLGWQFRRMLLDPESSFPSEIGGMPVQACLRGIAEAVAPVCGEALQQRLRQLQRLQSVLPGLTRDQLLRSTGARPWNA